MGLVHVVGCGMGGCGDYGVISLIKHRLWSNRVWYMVLLGRGEVMGREVWLGRWGMG